MKQVIQIIFLALCFSGFVSSPAMAASKCKGLSKTSCSTNKSCTWVDGYKRKDGVKVKSFCRSAPGKKATTAAKKKASKNTSAAKKKAVKEKAQSKTKAKSKSTSKSKTKSKEKVKKKIKDTKKN